jgi:hypothetical protein
MPPKKQALSNNTDYAQVGCAHCVGVGFACDQDIFTHFAQCHEDIGYLGRFVHAEELFPHLRKLSKQDGVVVPRFAERGDLLDERWEGAIVCKRTSQLCP